MAALGTRSEAVRGYVVSLLATFILLNSSAAAADSRDELKGRRCQDTNQVASLEEVDERALLAKHSAFIRRVGDTLELTVGNRVLKFEDVCDELREDEGVRYQFVDYLGDVGHVLIQESYYEGRRYSLVDRKYGVRQRIDAIPVFSPDRVHFLTVDIGDEHGANRLQIWRRRGQDWFEMVWSFQPYEYWAEASARWLDDRSIKLTKKVRTKPDSDAYVSKSFSIRLGTDGWRIVDDQKRVK